MMRLCATLFSIGFLAVLAAPAKVGTANSAPQLYRKYCVSCHGSDGRAKTSKGKFSHARDFTDSEWQDEVTDERIYNAIMNGRSARGNMPAFNNKLNQGEAESLVNFVRRFKTQGQE